MPPPADACFLPSTIVSGEEREGFRCCLTCTVASSENENLGRCNEEGKETFDSTSASSGVLLTLTASTSFSCFYVRTSDLLMSNAHLHIQRQRNSDKQIRVCKTCNWSHSSIYFSMKEAADFLRMHLPGARVNFSTLFPETKVEPGFGIHFMSGFSNSSSWVSLSYNTIPLYFTGIMFHGLTGNINRHYVPPPPRAGLISRMENERGGDEEEEGTWSSLPVLILWMIKDRLDIIFDNIRLGAVCRHWRLASASYPTSSIYSVGDGLPWIGHFKYGPHSNSWEFISVPMERKFEVEMPEFKDAVVLCSRDGWLLIKKRFIYRRCAYAETPALVSPLTGARIELPDLTGIRNYDGVFTTTSGGYPDRIFLIIKEPKSDVTIKTASPGDRVWTCHDFPPLGRESSLYHGFVVVGQKICCRDRWYGNITVFDVANNTVKDSAPLSRRGFIAEHNSELIYVALVYVAYPVRSREAVYDFDSYTVYRYNDVAPTLWEELSDGAVMDTSWYLRDHYSCVTAKGRGLKVYRLRQKRSERNWRFHDSFLDVHDLVNGGVQTLPVPFPDHHHLFWIGIG